MNLFREPIESIFGMQVNRIIHIILLLFSVLCLHAQVSVEAKIDSIQLLIGEQTDMTLSVKVKEGAKVKWPELKAEQYLTPGVELVQLGKTDTTVIDDGFLCISRTYTLTSFDENLYYIPPMKVLVDGKAYASKSLALKVLTVPVDTLHPEKFFPPKDVQDSPFLWSEWELSFWLSLLLVVLAVVTYYLWTRLRDNKPVVARVRIVKRMPPHQKALQEIEHLRADRMAASDDQKTYYTMLTDVIRKYINERFGFNATEMTSAEIIARLQQEGDKKMIDELKELFMTADLVKFAKYSTLINENDANLVNAVDFINNTKKEDQPVVERIAPKLSEEDKQRNRSRTVLKTAILVLAVCSAALLAFIVYEVYMLV